MAYSRENSAVSVYHLHIYQCTLDVDGCASTTAICLLADFLSSCTVFLHT